ncbi:MAG: VTT domain-containing protein [Nitrosopumilaceae archaeon]
MDFAAIFPFAPEVGYIGLTLVSFFGSLIPFVPLPSFLLLATMSVGDAFDLHLLAIISAVTATAAKVIVFSVSYEGRRIIGKASRKRMRPFERLVKRYGAGAAFFAAATPMPDDLIYVPLGLAKYNPKRFFIATLTGKLVLSYAIVFISHYMGLSLVEPLLEDVEDVSTIYIGIVIFAAMMTSVVILLLKLDWQRIMGRFAPWTLDENNSDEENSKD